MNDYLENKMLIEQMQQGSRPAFMKLYDKYAGMVYNYVLSVLGDEASAKDITQNCFISVWSSRESILPGGNFPAYLYVSARNAAYNELRRRVNAARYAAFMAMSAGDAHAAEMPSEHDMNVIESEFDVAVSALPESRRRIFLLKTKAHKTVKEIAEELDISPKTVETQISRAWSYIRKHISTLLAAAVLLELLKK